MDATKQHIPKAAKLARAPLALSRRPSRLGAQLEARKLKEAQSLSPSERLLIALRLSDMCREFKKLCSPKH